MKPKFKTMKIFFYIVKDLIVFVTKKIMNLILVMRIILMRNKLNV